MLRTLFGMGPKVDLKELKADSRDTVVGIAASGRTPYVIAALEYAKSVGCATVGVTCNRNSAVGAAADIAIEILGDRIYYVHLKNAHIVRGGGWFLTHMGDGDIDNRMFLKLLKDRGYQGKVGLEAPRPGDRDYFARVDLAYVRGVVKDLGWE